LTVRWPEFDGELSVDGEAVAEAGQDFGHLVRHRPAAVLRAGSVDDVVRIVRHARRAGLGLVARGAGHTTYGQAQLADGVVVDLRGLDRIQALTARTATVDAGITWRAVVEHTAAAGLTPPVLPDYLDLTVGGTLSVGGISGTSFHWGAQIDNVDELLVVTGEGDVVVCSEAEEPELFDAVLGGFGRVGIIVRATIRLVPAPDAVEVCRLPYDDPKAMAAALRSLADNGPFDYLLGIVTPGESRAWDVSIEAAVGVDGTAGGRPAGGECEVRTFADWVRRVDEPVGILRELGLWAAPHPWLDLFVGESFLDTMLTEVLGTPVLRGVGPLRILLYPLRRSRFTRRGLRLPEEEDIFLLDVLSNAVEADAQAMVEANRVLFERNRELGGTLYPISAVPGFSGGGLRPLPSGRGGRGRR
jgi:FAD/FMN-containing dehydrogenase